MADNRLDPLIDEIANAMTAAPSHPELARRVSMRIAEANERRASRRRPWRPWILVPVASVCVLLLAIFVVRERPGPYVERAFQARGHGDPERPPLKLRRSAEALAKA